ncbi:hypothetical protein LTR10_019671 [Elasticomyces elasticus]|uniref:Myb-like domain-containing protein n=1 Tax=Exophiala sideris TaxID=1016849 RepID=A0ABR0IY01_9EURO|nr:hypothetical protein LTR10_019671 [Elasticomyces elasticus]KAK5023569.1 hypothetical protein LTR13_011158 [Exophiala sideris]KAK5051209.1 hypothetical protein LTR69_010421 [Exophiala sideris]
MLAQDMVHYGFQDDVMLPEFQGHAESFLPEDISFDKQTVTFGCMTTPNTSSDAITPNMNTISPFIPIISDWNDQSSTFLPNSGQQTSPLGYDPGYWLPKINQSLAKQSFADPVLPEYPPLPELHDVPFDLAENFEEFASSPEESYLPAWYVETQALAPHSSGIETKWRTPVSERIVASPTKSGQVESRICQRDTSKDTLLLRCKAQGMSYRQIKELGKFEEAESTLRGRYRALTKPKEARLRKPEWGEREVQLLFEGVSQCTKSIMGASGPNEELDAISMGQFANKVPWKQVAEYMEGHGSYRYGNATVKKKYLEILKERGISMRTKGS